MAAADPSQCMRVVSSPLVPVPGHSERSPQVRALTVLPRPPRLLPRLLVARVSLCFASSPRRKSLSSAVRAPRAVSLPAGFLQTSPRDDALALGYRRGDRPRKGLSPPSQRPCWAHKSPEGGCAPPSVVWPNVSSTRLPVEGARPGSRTAFPLPG